MLYNSIEIFSFLVRMYFKETYSITGLGKTVI